MRDRCASWRGQATARFAAVADECRLLVEPKCPATVSWIGSIVERATGRAVGRGALRVDCVEDGGELEIDRRLPAERVVGDDPDQRALERADVVGDALGDEFEHAVVIDRMWSSARALTQDRHARGPIRRRQVRHQAGLEAFTQALLDAGELARQPVAGEDELPA